MIPLGRITVFTDPYTNSASMVKAEPSHAQLPFDLEREIDKTE